MTIRQGVRLSKSAFDVLAAKIHETDNLKEIELRVTAVEDDAALIAELHCESGKTNTTERLLIAGDGVVKLS